MEEEDHVEDNSELGVKPYQFEPVGERILSDISSSDRDSVSNEESSRLEEKTWCSCDHCQIMPTVRECLCCAEPGWLADKRRDLKCITAHEEIQSFLMPGILRVMAAGIKDLRGENMRPNVTNRQVTVYYDFICIY